MAQAINKKSGNGGTFTEKDEKVGSLCPVGRPSVWEEVVSLAHRGQTHGPVPCVHPAAAPSSLPLVKGGYTYTL